MNKKLVVLPNFLFIHLAPTLRRYPIFYQTSTILLCRGRGDGAVGKALASHQCGPGSIPAPGVMWVEFVVGSRPRSEGFSSGSPVFLPPQKSTLLNSNSIGNSGRRATLWKCHCKFPFIYLFLFYYYFI